VCLLDGNGSEVGANRERDGSMDNREVWEWAILGNRIVGRKRMLFSQEAGDMGFSLRTVLI